MVRYNEREMPKTSKPGPILALEQGDLIRNFLGVSILFYRLSGSVVWKRRTMKDEGRRSQRCCANCIHLSKNVSKWANSVVTVKKCAVLCHRIGHKIQAFYWTCRHFLNVQDVAFWYRWSHVDHCWHFTWKEGTFCYQMRKKKERNDRHSIEHLASRILNLLVITVLHHHCSNSNW